MRVLDRGCWPRALLLLGLAAGCGAAMGGGIAGTSSVVAPISGFGSIIVGGIEFDTTGAVITIEGEPAQASDLELGMVAAVRGVVDAQHARGVAQRVAVEHLAQGPLDALDLPTATLSLLGQQIVADSNTVFDPLPLADLGPGDFVEVWGFLGANGRIRATRIGRQRPGAEIDVQGNIRELDAQASSFRLGDLTVDFGSAIVVDPPPGGLREGLLVEVAAHVPPVAGVLSATNVEVVNPALIPDEGEGLKVEGLVTQVVSPSEVIVNGRQRVRITPSTRYEHGSSSDLVLDAHVDIDGVADADGALVATKVDFVSPGG